ncbi:hypothetical protein ACTXT7_008437 [Hymenolepis weldensis]
MFKEVVFFLHEDEAMSSCTYTLICICLCIPTHRHTLVIYLLVHFPLIPSFLHPSLKLSNLHRECSKGLPFIAVNPTSEEERSSTARLSKHLSFKSCKPGKRETYRNLK